MLLHTYCCHSCVGLRQYLKFRIAFKLSQHFKCYMMFDILKIVPFKGCIGLIVLAFQITYIPVIHQKPQKL